MTRRVVVSGDVFDDIDLQLPAERGPNGEPSADDFIAQDLTAIVQLMAEQWDNLPPRFAELTNIRVLIAAGRMVHAIVAVGMLLPDNTIEIVEVGIDR